MSRQRQSGAALLLALWATMLLAALLVGLAEASRSHAEAALYGAEHARAELAAEAGLARAVAGLRAPDARQRWIPDGRPYGLDFDGARVTVRIVDAGGLLDLNAASPQLLARLAVAAGMDGGAANGLAQALLAARQRQGASRAQPSGPMRSIEQLAQLPGMQPDVYAKLLPAVTVFSSRNFPDASYAGPLVLAALRGEPLAQARVEVAARRQRPAGIGAGNGSARGAVAGGMLVAGYGGALVRVFCEARMPDGNQAGLDATLRMALTGTGGRPYKVLAWRAVSARGED